MEFRVLGPVEAATAAGPVAIGGSKPRTLLAALLLESGRVVSTERLIDVIWDDDPPNSARALIQTYVSGMRRAGADLAAAIVTRPPGYLARVPPGSLDLEVFEALVERGRTAAAEGRHRDAVDALRSAEAMWRGPALGGVTGRILAGDAVKLDEQRVRAAEERIVAELALGRGEELVARLSALVGAHPTRERLRGQLMLALHRAGRTAEALEVYRQGRATLIEELGLEPGVELTRLHDAILRGDPDLLPATEEVEVRVAAVPPVAEDDAVGHRPVPAQLPPGPADFTGRVGDVEHLVELLTRSGRGSTVCVVAGPGGVGKSALAAHVGHRVATEYPDGQLHVDLRGMSGPATPAEVLGRFLRALDPDPRMLPERTDELMDRYRTLLFRRRMLIVLDDAAGEAQVRPLIPAAPGCAVLITSRNRLPGLAGAHLTELDMLSTAEATALLSQVAGVQRISAHPEAARQIVARCGGLPLAVRIAAARLATRRQWSPALLAARLADERQRLDELEVGDQQVRASIELSYRSLPSQAQVVLRRMGRLGLPDFAPWIAAALCDVPVAAAERLVEQLVDAHLVDYSFVDGAAQVRYRLHDLIRIYAQERADEQETRDDDVAATARVIAGWLGLAERLAEAQPAGTIQCTPRSSVARLSLPEVARTAEADPRAWLEAEQNAVVLSVERAGQLGLDELAVELASTLGGSVFPAHNLLDAWGRTHAAALAAARRAGNLQGEAVLLAELGQLRLEQDRFPAGREYLSQALATFRDAGDLRGEVAALAALGLACREQGYLPEAQHFLAQANQAVGALGDDGALGHCARLAGSVHLELGDFAAAGEALDAALAAYQRAGSRRGAALTDRTLALLHRARGDLVEAERYGLAALAIFEELADPLLTAYCVRTLAKTRLRMGRTDGLAAQLESVLATCRGAGDRWGEGMTLRTLGELHLATGRLDDAEQHLTAALAVWTALATPLLRARTLRDLAVLHDLRGDAAAADQVRGAAIGIFQIHRAREFTELTGGLIENPERT